MDAQKFEELARDVALEYVEQVGMVPLSNRELENCKEWGRALEFTDDAGLDTLERLIRVKVDYLQTRRYALVESIVATLERVGHGALRTPEMRAIERREECEFFHAAFGTVELAYWPAKQCVAVVQGRRYQVINDVKSPDRALRRFLLGLQP
jgi:hypothetical protein